MDDFHKFHPASPILRVENLALSLKYYEEKLGFSADWIDPGIIASVSRDSCNIMLAQGDQGRPGAWIYIGVFDVVPLFEEYKSKGTKIRHPPTNYWWAYEMQVEDLDGNVLRVGSSSRKDKAVGPWLDMDGNIWQKNSTGEWEPS